MGITVAIDQLMPFLFTTVNFSLSRNQSFDGMATARQERARLLPFFARNGFRGTGRSKCARANGDDQVNASIGLLYSPAQGDQTTQSNVLPHQTATSARARELGRNPLRPLCRLIIPGVIDQAMGNDIADNRSTDC